MLEVTTVEMNPDSREEYLPGYTPQFPHIASHVVAARYESSTTPWHWHESVEFFICAAVPSFTALRMRSA